MILLLLIIKALELLEHQTSHRTVRSNLYIRLHVFQIVKNGGKKCQSFIFEHFHQGPSVFFFFQYITYT